MDAALWVLDVFDRLLGNGGRALDHAPLVVQYNKMDVPSALEPADARRLFNPCGRPEFEAVAITGHGVIPTAQAVMRATLAGARDGWKAHAPPPLEPRRLTRRALRLVEQDAALAARLPAEMAVWFQGSLEDDGEA